MSQSPVTSRKRGRDSESSPLSRLLGQLKRLRVPSIDAAQANALIAPLVADCLKLSNDSSLEAILQAYGWRGDAFTAPVNLFGLSTALSKYRWVRVQELGSGSYAVVYKAKNRETDEIIALKKLRFGFDDQGLPSSTLREISLLKELKHENIVELKDVIFGFGSSSVYVVLECMDCDLRDLLDRDDAAVDMRRVKSYMHQILSAVHHAHMHCVMHRDLKPQNVLVDLASGRVKVADFGLARSFLPPHKAYTDKVVTLWYRAPELLLGARAYSPAIDMWSIGCIFAELVNREPLFRAESEIGLLHRVFEALGTPGEAAWAGVAQLANYRSNFPQWQHKGWPALVPRLAGDRLGLDLLAAMLTYDPSRRITAGQALAHPWFDDVRAAAAAAAAAADAAAPAPAPAPAAVAAAAPAPAPALAAAAAAGPGMRVPGGAAEQQEQQWPQQPPGLQGQQGPSTQQQQQQQQEGQQRQPLQPQQQQQQWHDVPEPLRQVQPPPPPPQPQQQHQAQPQQHRVPPQWVPQPPPRPYAAAAAAQQVQQAQPLRAQQHIDQVHKLQRAGPASGAAAGPSAATKAAAAAASVALWVPQPPPGHLAHAAAAYAVQHPPPQQQQQQQQQPGLAAPPHGLLLHPQHALPAPVPALHAAAPPVPMAITMAAAAAAAAPPRGKPPLPPVRH